MMTNTNRIKESIFTSILCFITVALMLWQFIIEGMITKANCFAVICFFICFIILFYAEIEIENSMIENHIIIRGLNYKIFLLLEKNKDSLYEFQEFCIAKRKKAIIQELALIRLFCGEQYDEDDSLKKYDNNEKEYFYSLLKNRKLKDKCRYKSDIKFAFATKGLPAHFYQFNSYYNGQLLKTQKNINGILLSAISIILGIVSLATIDAFVKLNLVFWLVLISYLLIEIIDIVMFWKTRLLHVAKSLNDTLDELSNDWDEFATSKQQLTNTELDT